MLNSRSILTALFFLLASANTAWASDLELRIGKHIDQCIHHNNTTLGKKYNCVTEGEKFVSKLQTADNKNDIWWQYAGVVRNKLGNNSSLQFYLKALRTEKTPERCIDDGLDSAIKYGLRLPHSGTYKSALLSTNQIVFTHCWDELGDEIQEMTLRGDSGYWMQNVCTELRKKGLKLKTCS